MNFFFFLNSFFFLVLNLLSLSLFFFLLFSKMIETDVFPLSSNNSDPLNSSKRNSRSLDLPVHPLAGVTSASNSIALRRNHNRSNSDGGKEMKILTQNIGTKNMIPLQDTEAALSAVLPPNPLDSDAPTHPLMTPPTPTHPLMSPHPLISPASPNTLESPSPTNNSLLFNFGLGSKRLPYRKQSYCTSFLQRVKYTPYTLLLFLLNCVYRIWLKWKIEQEEDLTFQHFQALQEEASHQIAIH